MRSLELSSAACHCPHMFKCHCASMKMKGDVGVRSISNVCRIYCMHASWRPSSLAPFQTDTQACLGKQHCNPRFQRLALRDSAYRHAEKSPQTTIAGRACSNWY